MSTGKPVTAGMRVLTPQGPGTVTEVYADIGHEVVDAEWTHGPGAPPVWYIVALDSGSEVTLLAGDLTE